MMSRKALLDSIDTEVLEASGPAENLWEGDTVPAGLDVRKPRYKFNATPTTCHCPNCGLRLYRLQNGAWVCGNQGHWYDQQGRLTSRELINYGEAR